MGYRYFDDQRLWDLTVEVFTRNGYSRSDCEDIANVLLASDRMGIESHGVQRMKLYTHSLEIGRIKRGAKSEIVRETPVSAVIDAHDAIGQPVSVAAMQMAIDKAKKAGVGIVVVRDSNHYGIAGYYAKMAADQGLLGISMTNTEALVVPTFGKQPMMGTNPIIGPNDERFGPRFPDMTEPYSLELRNLAKQTADELGIAYKEGVYMGFMGPCYETAAEIRAFAGMGADAVGMSTVPETMVCNYMGMKVLAVSCITNMATGIQTVKHSHARVLEIANQAGDTLCRWLGAVIQRME